MEFHSNNNGDDHAGCKALVETELISLIGLEMLQALSVLGSEDESMRLSARAIFRTGFLSSDAFHLHAIYFNGRLTYFPKVAGMRG